ncbi:MAG: SPASM domain-containing protein [Candidatus Aureabacteria bacterium]|nr:SPASM domain-containing protein [Candidatus Auribacterota bacterium]
MKQLLKMASGFLLSHETLSWPPLKIWVEITSVCNRECNECLNRLIHRENLHFMTKEEFSFILKKIPKATREVNLFHRGEPLLHKDIVWFIDLVKKEGKFVRLYTNGALDLGVEKILSLLRSSPDLIAFSLSHPLKEDFSSEKKAFEKAVKNVSLFLELRKREHLKKPYIKLEILSLGKEPDMKARKYLRENYDISSINKISFRKPHNWGGNLPLSIKKNTKIPNQCTFPWYALVILSDGTVTPCPQDFFGRLALGNIYQNDFEKIWNGEAMLDLRKRHAKRNLEGHACFHCDRIWRKTFLKVPLEHVRIFWER